MIEETDPSQLLQELEEQHGQLATIKATSSMLALLDMIIGHRGSEYRAELEECPALESGIVMLVFADGFEQSLRITAPEDEDSWIAKN